MQHVVVNDADGQDHQSIYDAPEKFNSVARLVQPDVLQREHPVHVQRVVPYLAHALICVANL
eukprot:CAMPEP_0114265818 /NCGR_PEP_ID=MMETSP0058-20121206/24188_1 /TAXON_ID=36894 /ORGANISM="Pyramimonas parkeae, CCMP726" /LENGTH=61 /DNA_ID=CAMNT_0001383075 /DNA_START=465 /DNA_END=646 /DNA_ORIENTATION=-